MLRIYGELFLGFFRAGIFGYGGGPASIPLMHEEAVKRYHWLTDEEFADILALGNTLPGPIATKMSGYIGYRVAGVMGLMVALVATIVPTVLLMGLFLGFLMQYKDSPRVQGITTAIQPVIAVMLLKMAYDFLKKATMKQGLKNTIFLALLSVIFLLVLDLHPAIFIIAIMVLAFLPRKGDKA